MENTPGENGEKDETLFRKGFQLIQEISFCYYGKHEIELATECKEFFFKIATDCNFFSQ